MCDATPGPLWMLENKNDDESIKKNDYPILTVDYFIKFMANNSV